MVPKKIVPSKSTLSNCKKFIGAKALRWMVAGILGAVVLGFVELGIASFLQLFLRSLGLLNLEAMGSSKFLSIDLSPLLVGVSLLALGLLRFAGQYFIAQSGAEIQEGISARLRQLLIHRILMDKTKGLSTASYSHYFLGTVFQTASFAAYLIMNAMSGVLQSVILASLMFKISYNEAIAAVLGLGALGGIVTFINKKVRAGTAVIPKENKSIVEGIERVSKNWLLVRILRTQNQEHRKFERNIATVLHHTLRSSRLVNLTASGTPLLGIGLIVVIVHLSQTYWKTPSLTLISFLYLFIRFVQGLASTVNLIGVINQYSPQLLEAYNFSKTFSELEVAEAVGIVKIASTLDSLPVEFSAQLPPSIRVSNLSYSYQDKPVISGLTFDLDGGRAMGIIGPSGSGKSTLLQLLIGILKPVSGKIEVGGIDSSLLLENTDMNIGYIGPEPFLFAGTVKENLCYGGTIADDESIWDALSKACLMDEILQFSSQLSHLLSENGDGLSAGQKQRLCIARIFLRKPKLIILDEATANLDIETEARLVESLSTFRDQATIIIVTHRHAALKYADFVLNLERQ